MNVGVKYRLPRRVPAIHSNVKALRVELLLKQVLDVPEESKDISVFFGCHLPW
jgi:hypothetical protein